jgi:hypothetical protein
VKYQDGKVYQITCDEIDSVYIGSTCEPILSRRLANHRNDYKQYLKGNRGYVTSFEIVQYPSAIITLIELVPCDSKDELLKRERFHIQISDGRVNKVVPMRSIKEYRNDSKEKIRKYYEDNKDKIKQSYVYDKEHKKQYRIANIEKINKYCADNKEKIYAVKKEYRKNNKESINARHRHQRKIKKYKKDLEDQKLRSKQLSDRFHSDMAMMQIMMHKIEKVIY